MFNFANDVEVEGENFITECSNDVVAACNATVARGSSRIQEGKYHRTSAVIEESSVKQGIVLNVWHKYIYND